MSLPCNTVSPHRDTMLCVCENASTHQELLQRQWIHDIASSAYVEIVEQPASNALRFRYECEGRSVGSIPGATSTPEKKTFPKIRVVGYKGPAYVLVFCVTKTEPYLTHPHNIVCRHGCERGVCIVEIPPENMSVEFKHLGVQCVRRRDVQKSLRLREEIKVLPYKRDCAAWKDLEFVDLSAIRLCFQVMLGTGVNKYVPLEPVVSDIIYDRKVARDLRIISMSDNVSFVDGRKKTIVLFSEKAVFHDNNTLNLASARLSEPTGQSIGNLQVTRDNIEVHFFENAKPGKPKWHKKAVCDVRKEHIWLRTPPYHTLDVREPVQVFIQLYRPSDGTRSEPEPFQLLPVNSVEPASRSVIPDRNSLSKLVIVKLSDYCSYVDGSQKDIILVCSKIGSDEIEVHFFEDATFDKPEWREKVVPSSNNVCEHVIWFRPPRYRDLDVKEPVQVFVQLYRPSDGTKSDPVPFEFLPKMAVVQKTIEYKRHDQDQVMDLLSDNKVLGQMSFWNIAPTGSGATQQQEQQQQQSTMAENTTAPGETPPEFMDLDDDQISSGQLRDHLSAIPSGSLPEIDGLSSDLCDDITSSDKN